MILPIIIERMTTEDDRRALWPWAIAFTVILFAIAGLGAARAETMLPHPKGCPRTAFCGCGAAVEIFGKPVRSLWLAANWLRFPRTSPAPGMVAARKGHVFVLDRHIGGNRWLARDHNSGGHKSRLHPRSIAGYRIVNPRAFNVAMMGGER